MVDQMTTLLSAILGLRKNNQPGEALEKLATSGDDILGMQRALLDRVDSGTAARMLGDPHKVRAYARLMREEAEILQELGRPAASSRVRSAELLIEASRMAGGVQPQDRVELEALGEVALTGSYLQGSQRIRG
jgi:hypothetical protein